MDGWNTSFLLGSPIFRCYVSFRECIYLLKFQSHPPTMSGSSPRWCRHFLHLDVIKFCWIPLEVDSGTFVENPPLPFFFIGREACKSQNEVVVSNIFYFHPENWRRWTQFWLLFFRICWFNHQLENHLSHLRLGGETSNIFYVHPKP